MDRRAQAEFRAASSRRLRHLDSCKLVELVDRDALSGAQERGDIVAANDTLKDAYDTDVRPVIARWRVARGLAADPVAAYLRSGEAEGRERERAEGVAAGWG